MLPEAEDPFLILSEDEAREVDEVCQRFESAWVKPRIEDYQQLASPNSREALMAELIKLEVELKQSEQSNASVADYIERFPEHQGLISSLFEQQVATAVCEKPITTPLSGSHGVIEESESHARYEWLHAHAQGGLGKVSVALDRDFGRNVAIKEMRGECRADVSKRSRFIREAEVTGRLEHPGIVTVYSLGKNEAGSPFYAMQFIRGESLDEVVKELYARKSGADWALSFRNLLTRFIDVCHAVQYAHSQGVIHRDIKPQNIMVGPHGETVLLDWGLAKAGNTNTSQENTSTNSTLTQDGSIMGTPAYMSAEQALGEPDAITEASDVYGLGATLFHLLANRAPFEAGTVDILERVRSGDVPSPATLRKKVPPALNSICLKAMSLDTKDRYGSAEELAGEIERWLADEPVLAHKETSVAKLARVARRHRALAVSLGVGMAVLALAACIVLAIILVSNRRLRDANTTISNKNAELKLSQTEIEEANVRIIEEQQQTEVVKDFLLSVLQSPNPERNGYDVTVGEALQQAEGKLEQLEDVWTRIEVTYYFAKSYDELGFYQDAMRLMNQAYTLSIEDMTERTLDSDLSTLEYLGLICLNAGEISKASEHFEQALAIAEQRNLPEERVAVIEQKMYATLLHSGRLEEALALSKKQLEFCLEQYGPHKIQTILAQIDHGSVFQKMKEYEAAYELYSAALVAAQTGFGKESALALQATNNVAAVLNNMHRNEEAYELLSANIEAVERHFGLEHPNTLVMKGSIVDCLAELKRYEEAEALQLEVLEKQRSLLGDSHFATLESMSVLVNIRSKTGQDQKIVELIDSFFSDTSVSDLAAQDHLTLKVKLKRQYAQALTRTSQFKKALKTRGEVIQLAVLAFGELSWQHLAAQCDLITSHIKQGQPNASWKSALALFESSIAKSAELDEKQRENLFKLGETLQDYCREFEKSNQQLSIAEQGFRLAATNWGFGSDPYNRQVGRLVALHFERGESDKAIKLVKTAIAQGVNELKLESEVGRPFLQMLAVTLVDAKRWREAQQVLAQLAENFEVGDTDPEQLSEYLFTLAMSHLEQKELKQAADALRRCEDASHEWQAPDWFLARLKSAQGELAFYASPGDAAKNMVLEAHAMLKDVSLPFAEKSKLMKESEARLRLVGVEIPN